MYLSKLKSAVALATAAFVLIALGTVAVKLATGGADQAAEKDADADRVSYPMGFGLDDHVKERLAELKKQEEKSPARVGQIFLIGNKKIADVDILNEIDLCPGKILNFSDLRLAEQRLARLKGLKSNPKVTAIDREGNGVFKDIQITVEEK